MRRRPPGHVLAAAMLVDRDRGLVTVRDRPDDVLRVRTRRRRRRTRRGASTRRSSCRPPACPSGRTRCRCRARSTGKPFSWPIATSTSSQGKWTSGSPVGSSWRRPLASNCAATFSNVTPVSLPASCVIAFGTRKLWIGMPSCAASSFSHGEAFISAKPERTTTCTSSPPSRRALRQQSIAVLPPPSTTTRLPIFVVWPNDTLDSQSMPMWMLAAASLRPGTSMSRPRGAPLPTNTASQPSASRRLQAVDPLLRAELDAEVEHVAHFLVDHGFGQPELRNLRAHHAAGTTVAVEHDAVVAERREVARHGERSRTGADERDALAVLRRGRPRKGVADVLLVIGRDALQPADRHRLGLDLPGVATLFDAAATARGLAGTVAGAPEDAGKDIGLPVDEIGVAVAARRDQADVFRNGRVGGTRPLAIDDLVEIVGMRDIRRLQDILLR